MSTRKIIDPKQNGEKVWLKGHAQAIYMSDGSTVEDAINSIEIPSLDEYVTETELNDKGFLTEHQDISHLASKEWVNNKNYATEYDLKTIDYSTINNVPVSEDESGELNITDESGNIGMKVASEAVYAKDFVAGGHKLSEKVDKTYVDNSIAELVDGAPETLDTLNELSAALKDNADIVDVLNQSIGSKQDKLVSGTNIITINGNSILGSGNLDLATSTQLRDYQPKLVSGTSIKTINGESILGSGDIEISGGGNNNIGFIEIGNNFSESTEGGTTIYELLISSEQLNICLDDNITALVISSSVNEKICVLQKTQRTIEQPSGLECRFSGIVNNNMLRLYVTEMSILLHCNELALKTEIPNTSNLATKDELSQKQDTLVSGTNIKTINSTSLLGSGNIAIKDTKNLTYSLNNSTSGTVTLLPNVCIYMPNVLTGKLAINACSTISSNNADLIESRICFRMPNTALPAIQFNGVAIRWAGGNAPTFEADFTYEVSLFYPSNANSVGPMGVCVGFK